MFWRCKILIILFSCLIACAALADDQKSPFVAILPMDMMILPGTQSYLEKGLERATDEGAKIAIVTLNTPGGLLDSAQHMIQLLFKSKIPVVIYVSPSGSTATSAGVFITLAGHVAAMAPGTSIGAAHPVNSDGKDIDGDMRAKVENMTIALVKSISEQRGRNVEWAEKSIKESSSITDKDALRMSVVDIVADNFDDLLKRIAGKEVKLDTKHFVLEDYSKLPRRVMDMEAREKLTNVLANPNVAALLWLAATTGISIELYNPGAILPGVVGVISLILALAVSQVIPINQGAILLFIVGALLIGAELYVPSGILGIGGIIAMVLGSVYLMDSSAAPEMSVSLQFVLPVALVLGAFMLFVVTRGAKMLRLRSSSGLDGLIGQHGVVTETVAEVGKIFVNGEIWKASAKQGILEKDSKVEVIGVKDGMVLEVKKI